MNGLNNPQGAHVSYSGLIVIVYHFRKVVYTSSSNRFLSVMYHIANTAYLTIPYTANRFMKNIVSAR